LLEVGIGNKNNPAVSRSPIISNQFRQRGGGGGAGATGRSGGGPDLADPVGCTALSRPAGMVINGVAPARTWRG
jgi:hypothetical protein